MNYVLIFLPQCLKCDCNKSSLSISQFDPNQPVTEIEEQTNLELTQIEKTNQTNKKLTITTNLNSKMIANESNELTNEKLINDKSINSASKLNLKSNSSSIDLKSTSSSPAFKKNLIKPETTMDKQINLKFKDEDLNNNENESNDQLDEEKPKIEMKTFKKKFKIAKGISYESDCSYSPEVNLQSNYIQKNGKTKKMIVNRNSVKQMQRSCSEKSGDNTAKQVIFKKIIFK